MKKILVIGSLNVDFSTEVERIPLIGETVNGKNLLINNGGKGANQAYTIGKLGGNVSMIGMVGNDIYGKNMKESLSSVNVNTNDIVQTDIAETGKAFINVDNLGNNSIVIIHGANYLVTSDFIKEKEELIRNSDIILLQLEIPIDTVKTILEIAKDKIVIVDPAPANEKLMDFDLSNVYLMKPNETELMALTGTTIDEENSIISAGRKLLNRGVKNILVSLGDKGSLLINNEKVVNFECIKSNVVDTTAAGDSFIASVALGLSKDYSLEESVRFASKVASIVVTKKGAQSSIPSIEEVSGGEKEC